MGLFKLENGKAKSVRFSKFKNEGELQDLVEKNLEEIFGLKFVEHEFTVSPFRLDTVAFDPESEAFVIIEYKESEHDRIVDQGITYLNLLLNHKGDFQIALERRFDKNKIKIDWTQSRTIFIAKSFNLYQLGALTTNMPFELWKYIYYEGDMVSFEQLNPLFAQGSGLPLGRIAQRIPKEIKVYSLDDHLGGKNQTIKEIFEKLDQGILNIGPEIKQKVKKNYIAYEVKKNFTEFVVQSSAVEIYLDIPISELRDASHVAEDCSKVGHWGTGNTRFKVHHSDEIPYALELIRQAYARNLSS